LILHYGFFIFYHTDSSSKNDIEIDQKIDVQEESKVLRHFRSVLIDFVKELLKPTWREGHLSEDAHNTVVKKTAEKVLSSLQPHQIPAAVESIKQFLSSSQPKMTKLVEVSILFERSHVGRDI
jgi:hypothetical protein